MEKKIFSLEDEKKLQIPKIWLSKSLLGRGSWSPKLKSDSFCYKENFLFLTIIVSDVIKLWTLTSSLQQVFFSPSLAVTSGSGAIHSRLCSLLDTQGQAWAWNLTTLVILRKDSNLLAMVVSMAGAWTSLDPDTDTWLGYGIIFNSYVFSEAPSRFGIY